MLGRARLLKCHNHHLCRSEQIGIYLFERGIPNAEVQRGSEPDYHGDQDHGLPTQQVPAYGSKHRSGTPGRGGSR